MRMTIYIGCFVALLGAATGEAQHYYCYTEDGGTVELCVFDSLITLKFAGIMQSCRVERVPPSCCLPSFVRP